MASRQATGTPQWLEDKLKEVLGWDDFVIQGVVGAIEAATEAGKSTPDES